MSLRPSSGVFSTLQVQPTRAEVKGRKEEPAARMEKVFILVLVVGFGEGKGGRNEENER